MRTNPRKKRLPDPGNKRPDTEEQPGEFPQRGQDRGQATAELQTQAASPDIDGEEELGRWAIPGS